jgi:hypothetical protein
MIYDKYVNILQIFHRIICQEFSDLALGIEVEALLGRMAELQDWLPISGGRANIHGI